MDTMLTFLGGFSVLLNPAVMGFMIAGFLIGTFFGAMPGLTSVLAIALLLPLTYSIDVIPALVMCAAIFMAGMYSGSITATTINIPGAPSSMMTSIEGNILMKRGQGANALGHAALGSMIGGWDWRFRVDDVYANRISAGLVDPDTRQILAGVVRAGRDYHC